MNSTIRIAMDDKATKEEKEAAKKILEEAGLTAELGTRAIVRKSFDVLPWIIQLSIPLLTLFFRCS